MIREALLLSRKNQIADLVILTDSLLSIQSINSGRSSRTEILHQIWYLAVKLNATIAWIRSHIGIRGNDVADQAAKLVLTKPAPTL